MLQGGEAGGPYCTTPNTRIRLGLDRVFNEEWRSRADRTGQVWLVGRQELVGHTGDKR